MKTVGIFFVLACLAGYTLASSHFNRDSEHEVENVVFEWLLSDPFLVTSFNQYYKAKAAPLSGFMDASETGKANDHSVNKRNSELLNSLLGLPKNILRSGRK